MKGPLVALSLLCGVPLAAAEPPGTHPVERSACRDWAFHFTNRLGRLSAGGLVPDEVRALVVEQVDVLAPVCVGPGHARAIRRFALLDEMLDDFEEHDDTVAN